MGSFDTDYAKLAESPEQLPVGVEFVIIKTNASHADMLKYSQLIKSLLTHFK